MEVQKLVSTAQEIMRKVQNKPKVQKVKEKYHRVQIIVVNFRQWDSREGNFPHLGVVQPLCQAGNS